MNPTGQPMGVPSPNPSSAGAAEAVNVPAILLMATGGLTVLEFLYSGVMMLAGKQDIPAQLADNPQAAQAMQLMSKFGVLFLVPWFGVAALIVYAGFQMRQLKSYGLVTAGAILAMIPCCTVYCCVPGLAAGIWTLIVINKPEVKSAFT